VSLSNRRGDKPHPTQIIGRTLRSLAFTQFHTLNCAKYPVDGEGEALPLLAGGNRGAGDRFTSPICVICGIWLTFLLSRRTLLFVAFPLLTLP